MSLEENNNHEILPEDIRNFKIIVHQLFNQSNKKLSIQKNNGDFKYKAQISKERITLIIAPSAKSPNSEKYLYNLTNGNLINNINNEVINNQRISFYQKIETICNDIETNNAQVEEVNE